MGQARGRHDARLLQTRHALTPRGTPLPFDTQAVAASDSPQASDLVVAEVRGIG